MSLLSRSRRFQKHAKWIWYVILYLIPFFLRCFEIHSYKNALLFISRSFWVIVYSFQKFVIQNQKHIFFLRIEHVCLPLKMSDLYYFVRREMSVRVDFNPIYYRQIVERYFDIQRRIHSQQRWLPYEHRIWCVPHSYLVMNYDRIN